MTVATGVEEIYGDADEGGRLPLLAIVVRWTARLPRPDGGPAGATFFTDRELSQQLGLFHRPAGYVVAAHVHNAVPREVRYTQECLFIRAGKLRVDLYGDDRRLVESRTLVAGDVILLVGGGHGMEAVTDVEFFEVKNGGYAGPADKTVFEGRAFCRGV